MTRWLRQDADFREQLRQRRSELTAHASGRIVALLSKAVDVLRDALEGKDITKDSFLAAKLTIEAARAIEADDLIERVERLEAIASQPRGQYNNDERPVEEIKESIRRLNKMLGGVFLDEDTAAGNGDGNGEGDGPVSPTIEDLQRAGAALRDRVADQLEDDD